MLAFLPCVKLQQAWINLSMCQQFVMRTRLYNSSFSEHSDTICEACQGGMMGD
jgi:hypothetical protein